MQQCSNVKDGTVTGISVETVGMVLAKNWLTEILSHLVIDQFGMEHNNNNNNNNINDYELSL